MLGVYSNDEDPQHKLRRMNGLQPFIAPAPGKAVATDQLRLQMPGLAPPVAATAVDLTHLERSQPPDTTDAAQYVKNVVQSLAAVRSAVIGGRNPPVMRERTLR